VGLQKKKQPHPSFERKEKKAVFFPRRGKEEGGGLSGGKEVRGSPRGRLFRRGGRGEKSVCAYLASMKERKASSP